MPESSDSSVVNEVEKGLPQTLAELAELVAIPSVSWPSHDASHVVHSAEFVAEMARGLGIFDTVTVERATIADGRHLGQPAVIARRHPRKNRPTVMLYAHHDVQPAGDEKEWNTPPFEMTIIEDRAFGRGAADDKAGIMCHVASLRALVSQAADPDLGLVLFIEGEEEYGSPSFATMLREQREALAADIIVVADSTNWTTNLPALTVSLRGNANLAVTVSTLDHALHSGMFGGAVPDAMMAMTRLLASLHDDDGAVAVSGLVATHRGVSPEYDESRLRDEAGLLGSVSPIGYGDILERIWSRPAITVTGIDMPSVAEASNTLAASVRACVSIRVAPGQSASLAAEIVTAHLITNAPWGAQVKVELVASGEGFEADTRSHGMVQMREAITDAWGVEPIDMGVGGSIPFIAEFREVFPDSDIVVTGIEDPDTRAHSPNESLHIPGLVRSATAEALFLLRLNESAGKI